MTTHELDGYLRKRGLRVKTWKRRFFTFKDGVLTYKKDHRENTKIIKREEVENVLYWSGKKHGFCVYLSSGRQLYVSASSEEEATRWYNAVEDYLHRRQISQDFRKLLCRPHLAPIMEVCGE